MPVADQSWTSDPFEMDQRDGRLYGRGTCDMKGFIAAAVAKAAKFAALDLIRPLHFAFTYEEEVGCLGGKALAADSQAQGLRPAVVIVGEPTEMRVIEGHKGCREYSTHFKGLEGHGSAPDHGVNAVEFAARYASWLLDLREDLKSRTPAGSRFEPPWSTLNVGEFRGGVAPNVIAGTARVDWDFRAVVPEDGDYVDMREAEYVNSVLLPKMRAVSADAGIRTEKLGDVAGFTPVPDSEAVRIVSELTGANGTDVVAFGTEAGVFQQIGMSPVVCGPGSIAQAHKPDEFIEINQLSACLDMLDGLETKLTA